MADDLNRDDSVPSQPEEAGRVRLPPAPAYVPPTRRQLRESEARAKQREKDLDATAPHGAAPARAGEQPATPAAAAAPTSAAIWPLENSVASGRRRQEPLDEPVAATPIARTTESDAGAPLTVENLFGSSDGSWPPPPQPASSAPRRKRRRWRALVWVLVVLLVLGGGAAATAWVLFEDQVREVLGIELPNDYEGTGNGEAVTVTIVAGDVGSDIATKLQEAGVTMTYDAFYDLLVAQEVQPSFIPGSYPLQKEMSAQSALDVLSDSANIATSRVLVIEGATLPQTLASLSEGTGLLLADFEAAAANFTALGVPANAPNLEGWLFPATYDFEPGVSAQQMLQAMADRMVQALDEAGVAVDDRERVLTLASIVQKEGGSVEDFPIVARLFLNRLALTPPMNLESDATVSYGTGGTSIFTTDAERADASNLYNTYANPGLPVGPISAPGDDAIRAVLNPAAGDWLYMVLVNGDTGETKFSNTYEEHLAAVDEWQVWIQAHPEWDN